MTGQEFGTRTTEDDMFGDEMLMIPATILRGGTSKGVYLLEDDLPDDRSLWGPYLLELFGSQSVRQIGGLGGGDSTTSKCCIIGRASDPEIDVNYTFAQVGIGEERVYWDMNCGNLSSSVGTFAVMAGLVPAEAPVTTVRAYQTNTRRMLRIEVPVGDRGLLVDGPLAIGGVPGTGAPVQVDFSGTVGASLDRGLFPTGHRVDTLHVDGVGELECSIVDLANMCIFFRAEDVGATGYEGVVDGPRLHPTYEAIRIAAQRALGLPIDSSTPWPVSVAAPRDYQATKGDIISVDDYDVAVRFIAIPSMLDTMHQAFPGTAASCVSVAASASGTVVNAVYEKSGRDRDGEVAIGHPSGVMRIGTQISEQDGMLSVERVTTARTVRPIMRGEAYLRASEVLRLTAALPADSPTRSGVPEPH